MFPSLLSNVPIEAAHYSCACKRQTGIVLRATSRQPFCPLPCRYKDTTGWLQFQSGADLGCCPGCTASSGSSGSSGNCLLFC